MVARSLNGFRQSRLCYAKGVPPPCLRTQVDRIDGQRFELIEVEGVFRFTLHHIREQWRDARRLATGLSLRPRIESLRNVSQRSGRARAATDRHGLREEGAPEHCRASCSSACVASETARAAIVGRRQGPRRRWHAIAALLSVAPRCERRPW